MWIIIFFSIAECLIAKTQALGMVMYIFILLWTKKTCLYVTLQCLFMYTYNYNVCSTNNSRQSISIVAEIAYRRTGKRSKKCMTHMNHITYLIKLCNASLLFFVAWRDKSMSKIRFIRRRNTIIAYYAKNSYFFLLTNFFHK